MKTLLLIIALSHSTTQAYEPVPRYFGVHEHCKPLNYAGNIPDEQFKCTGIGEIFRDRDSSTNLAKYGPIEKVKSVLYMSNVFFVV